MTASPTTFEGYRRADGRVATRAHVVVAPASLHVNRVCEQVQERCPQAVCVTHQAPLGPEDVLARRTLAGFLSHPNVHEAIVVALSRSDPALGPLLAELAERGCRPRVVTLVDEGGLAPAAARATALCEAALATAAAARREPVPLAELVLGTECGGSDANSGLTANPAVGVCADELVAAGGTVILAEMTELIGAEHELAARAETPELAERIVGAVGRWERFALEFGEDITGGNPCHGNIVGGITTIEEKSLGCVRKSGHGTVVDLVGFAEPSPRRGLVVMDTSGDDLEQLIAMTAGGANVIVFTTGRGTPTASPLVPTVKVSTTSALAARLGDMIDFDAGGVLDGGETLAQAGRRLLCDVVAVAGGRETSAERGGQRDFALPVTAAGA